MKKKYKVRPIKADDFTYLIDWWNHYDHCEVPSVDLLPNGGLGGLVIEKKGKPIMAAFMDLTNSAIGYLDFLVRDPNYNEKDKNDMMWDLQDACGAFLLDQGCRLIWGMTSYDSVANMAKEIGYDVMDDKYNLVYIHKKVYDDIKNK